MIINPNLAPAPRDYTEADQNELRRSITTLAQQVIATTTSVASDTTALQAEADTTKTKLDGSIDDGGLLITGVASNASIGTEIAGYVGRAQHGIFNETFEKVPDDYDDEAIYNAGSLQAGVGQSGGNAFQAVGEAWKQFKYNIAFDPSKLYRIRARIKQVSGSPYSYTGVAGVAADGVTLVNADGINSPSSQHYMAPKSVQVPTDGAWHEYTAWFKGWGATDGYSGSGTPTDPYKLHPNVRYFRPLFILNYGGTPSDTAQIDEISIDVQDEDAINRAYTALASNGGLNRGASGSVAIETLAATVGVNPLNMLANAGGQSGAIGAAAPNWNISIGNGFIIDDTTVKWGDRALKLSPNASTSSAPYQYVNLVAGQVYRFSAWIYNSNNSYAVIRAEPTTGLTTDIGIIDVVGVDSGTGGFGWVGDVGALPGVGDWGFVQLTFQANYTGTWIFETYLFSGTTGDAWFDGVELVQLPPNSTIGGARGKLALDANGRLTTAVNWGAKINDLDVGEITTAAGTSLFREVWGSLPGSRWNVGAGTIALIPATGEVGVNVLQVQNNGALLCNTKVPYNPSKLHRIRARFRRTVDPSASNYLYCGVIGYDSSGAVTNNNSGAQYVCADGTIISVADGWVEYTGWFMGASAAYSAGSPGPSTDPTAPTALSANTTQISPYILTNYNVNGGTTQIDYLEIDVFDEDAAARLYAALSGIGTLNGTVTQLDSAGSRVLQRGYQSFLARNGDALVYNPVYLTSPKFRISGGLTNDPGAHWGPLGNGTESNANNGGRTYQDFTLLGPSAGGAVVRARLRQKGTTASHSDTWTGTDTVTTAGAAVSKMSPAATASNDTYSVTVTLTLNLVYDTAFGKSQTISASCSLHGDPGAGAGTMLDSRTASLNSTGGDIEQAFNFTLTGTMAGGSSSSTFWVVLDTFTDPWHHSNVILSAFKLNYVTGSGDQYASATPDADDYVLVELWDA